MAEPSSAAPGKSVAAWVLWGPYEAATLLSVQAGLYEVQFAADGSKRWASSAELLSLSPPSSVPPQHLVLLPRDTPPLARDARTPHPTSSPGHPRSRKSFTSA